MELNPTNRLRRSGQLIKPQTGIKGARIPRPAGALGRSRADRLALSRQAAALLEQHSRQVWEQGQKEQNSYEKSLLEYLRKSGKMLNKCQLIAARISAGDRVPPEDIQYLMNHDPDGYKLALASRKPKKHPREYESVLDDEDRGRNAGVEGEAEASPAGELLSVQTESN